MLVQKFHSIDSIDLEFISGLEELLEFSVINFDQLRDWVHSAPEQVHFSFYLFFNPVKNTPVGFAMAQMTKIEANSTGMFGLFKKKHNQVSLQWSIPGAQKKSIVYNPLFEEEVIAQFIKVRQEFNKRDNLIHEEIYESNPILKIKLEEDAYKIVKGPFHSSPLKKTFNDVESFFNSLNLNYERIFNNCVLKLKENKGKVEIHRTFKDIFRNKPNTTELYQAYKSHPKFKNHKSADLYICLWTEGELMQVLTFHVGASKKCFVELIDLAGKMTRDIEEILLTMMIDQFYHLEDAHDLIISPENLSRKLLSVFNIKTHDSWVAIKDWKSVREFQTIAS